MEHHASESPLPGERLAIIRSRLARDGRVLAADLAREFATSEDTVRRDLRGLAEAGLCRRVYGGALPLSPASGPLRARRDEATGRKALLGTAAAALVRAGQLVVIDAGSTNLAIARALPDGLRLTVATNAISIATVLEPKTSIALLLIGGRHDRATGSALGLAAIRAAERMRPDLYFAGACALDPAVGLSVFDAEEAELKRTFAEASAAVATAMTDEKLGSVAPHAVLPWASLDHLIVEAATSVAERIGPVPAQGPRLQIADEAGR